MKTCIKCKITKTFINYYKASSTKDGYNGKCKDCIRDYYKINKKRIISKAREYKRKLYSTDKGRIEKRLRHRIYMAFKTSSWNKNNKTKDILGADYNVVKNYIESLFIENMSWDNKGEWHIDHIIPLSSAKNEKELIELCHYKNLQPLWAEDNLKKGKKYEYNSADNL